MMILILGRKLVKYIGKNIDFLLYIKYIKLKEKEFFTFFIKKFEFKPTFLIFAI